TEDQLPPEKLGKLVIIPIDDLNYASMRAISFARTIEAEKLILHVSIDPERSEKMREKVERYVPDMKLVIVESPTVSFIQPMINYVSAIHRQEPDALVTIVFPEFIAARWWERFLHNRTAQRLYRAFETHPNVAVVMVPYLLEE